MSTTPLPAGTLARAKGISRDVDIQRIIDRNTLFVIEDYVSAADAEDGITFYWASSDGTGSVNDIAIEARFVELVKTAEQMNARRIPNVDELRAYLGSALLGDADTFDVTETDRDGNGVEIAGKTHDGLRFAATIQITSIYEADF